MRHPAVLWLDCGLTLVAACCDKENNAGKDYYQSVVQVPSQHAEINDNTALAVDAPCGVALAVPMPRRLLAFWSVFLFDLRAVFPSRPAFAQ